MIRKKKKSSCELKKVSCSILNVRKEPSTASFVSSVLRKDDIVECDIKFKDEKWDHVLLNSKEIGYCMKRFLEPFEPEIEPDGIFMSETLNND